MKETHTFRIPDYFPYFTCKMGQCRNACCQGWPISITLQNYFDLLGLECSPDLRRRLDGGMHLADNPSPDHYAQFSPRYDGNCPLRLEDGRCALHADIGEEVLPDICRLYPRGIRLEKGKLECSLAGSCEGVLELFLHREAPVGFIEKELELTLPPHLEERSAYFETMGRDWDIRLHFIKILQNRTMPLSERMLTLGRRVHKTDAVMQAKDEAALDVLLAEPEDTAPDLPAGSADVLDKEHLLSGLWVAEKLTALLDSRHNSIQEYGEAALAYFGDGEESMERYKKAKKHLETLFPDWEIFFEHMLVNHMFFAQFPFQDRPESLQQEYTALCAVYMLMRFLTIGCMAEKTAEEDLIDICAALFRLIEHTSFDRYAALMLKSVGCASPADVENLIRL
ncbi:MAG: flagellin lysine-N-methylase [Clostridia bacterium]|nr:flagellin lysine-N-methylase [Clostridia bacterium]